MGGYDIEFFSNVVSVLCKVFVMVDCTCDCVYEDTRFAVSVLSCDIRANVVSQKSQFRSQGGRIHSCQNLWFKSLNVLTVISYG